MFKIAIDGPAGSGKSTISKILANKLNFEYIDTGAMYRAVTLKGLKLGVNLENEAEYDYLDSTVLDICNGRYLIDGEDVSEAIRSVEVTKAVSTPSKIGRVRDYLVDYQRKICSARNCIVDGRDIGTVVLPDASLKIYLDATIECRATRRMLERALKGVELSLKETIKEIELRDYKDSTRKHSPLRCAEDAIVIDSTDLSIDEVVSRILLLVNERIKKMSKHAYSEGQIVKGMIVNVTKEAIYLTLNEETKAVIYANDLKGYTEGQKLYNLYYEGQEFEGSVKQIAKDKKSGQDLYILSTKLEDEKEKLNVFEEIKEKDEIIKAKVVKVTSAGADLEYEGFKLFLPAKYVDLSEEALRNLKGETLDVMVLFVNKDRMQVTVSNVMAAKKQYRLAKEAAYAALSVDMVLEGTVENVLPYGAIVNLGEVSGLLHQSEIDHKPVRNVANKVKVGEKLTVKIIGIEGNKISLSVKALTPHPWSVLKEQYHVGDVFEGTVEKIIPAGLIIKLTDDYSGLMLRSEYSWFANVKVDDNVQEGDKLVVKVMAIDDAKNRVSLSHKATLENTWADIKVRRGDKIEVTVASINERGALVNYKNVQGFLPVNEVTAAKRISKVDEVFAVDSVVEVLVQECDPSVAKLRVSAKALELAKEREQFDKYFAEQAKETPTSTIGDLLGNIDLEEK